MSRLDEILQKEKEIFEYMSQKNKKITIEDIQNIEESWDICDPMFNMINGCEGYDKYLKTSERFTLEQRYLCAIHWYFGEVINGGIINFSTTLQELFGKMC